MQYQCFLNALRGLVSEKECWCGDLSGGCQATNHIFAHNVTLLLSENGQTDHQEIYQSQTDNEYLVKLFVCEQAISSKYIPNLN